MRVYKKYDIWQYGAFHKAASKLESFLSPFPKDSPNDPLFTVVFDEVHSLMERTQRKGLLDGGKVRAIELSRIDARVLSINAVMYMAQKRFIV